MSHVRIKIIIAAMTAAALLTACSSNDNSQAEALLKEADAAVGEGQYQTAVMLLDSLKSAYPRAIDVRKRALHTAAVAAEGLALESVQRADSTVAVLTVRTDSMQQLMKKVDNPVEPYFVAAACDPADVRKVTGLQARMTPDGDLYLISTLKGKDALSTRVTVTALSGESASTATVAFDGERNDRTPDTETITFMGSECEDICHFIASHKNEAMKLTFDGTRPATVNLSAAQAAAIATVYEAASTLRALRVANVEKERASRALDLARSQAARTFVEENQ